MVICAQDNHDKGLNIYFGNYIKANQNRFLKREEVKSFSLSFSGNG